MMLYKNSYTRFYSHDDDTNFIDIITGVLKRYTLEPYMFIICLDYILQMPIEGDSMSIQPMNVTPPKKKKKKKKKKRFFFSLLCLL